MCPSTKQILFKYWSHSNAARLCQAAKSEAASSTQAKNSFRQDRFVVATQYVASYLEAMAFE